MFVIPQGKSRSEYNEFMRDLKKKLSEGILIQLNDKRFLVVYHSYDYTSDHASMQSPMGDGFITSSDDIDVVDVDELHIEYGVDVNSSLDYNDAYASCKIPTLNTCKRNFPRILVHLIGRYGFYEGLQSKYRQDPEDIAGFLNIRPLKETI